MSDPVDVEKELAGAGASATDSADELARLRRLILAVEQERLGELERRLDDPEVRADELGHVLPEALARAGHHGNRLSLALAPVVEEALGVSIRKNRKHLADALAPAMGPAIRRAIAEALRTMVDSLNQVMQHSLSPRALRWRVEAWRSGRPFGEVVLSHSLVYRVEQVFLVHRASGLLLQHAAADPGLAKDGDLISGMLTAIQDFVRDSFSAGADEAVGTMRVGDLTVWVEQGEEAYLAAAIRGAPPVELRAVLRDALESIHLDLGEAFAAFSGDAAAFEPAHGYLEGCLQMRVQGRGERRFWLAPAIAAGVLILLLGVWGALSLRAGRRWNAYLARLSAEPGIVVVFEQGGVLSSQVSGLRDPLAADPARLLGGLGLDPARVNGRWAPYLSQEPAIVLARARALLRPPDGVTLAFAGGTLSATGAAPHDWVAEARRRGPAIPGVERLDLDALGDAGMTAAAGPTRRLEAVTLRFDSGSAELARHEEAALETAAAALAELAAVARDAGLRLRVEVIGHTDGTGSEHTNVDLSRARADRVAAALEARGAGPLELASLGVGASQPLRAERSEDDRAENRSVTFRVIVAP